MGNTLALPSPNDIMPNKTKPIHEVRLGYIKAAVWKNETEAGVRYNATFSRLFKNGDQWASTESFGRDDLLTLAKVADQTHSWICAQGQEEQATAQPPASRAANEH
jgi:hypothetical protein